MARSALAHDLTVATADIDPGADRSKVGRPFYVNAMEPLFFKDPPSEQSVFGPDLATSWEITSPTEVSRTIR